MSGVGDREHLLAELHQNLTAAAYPEPRRRIREMFERLLDDLATAERAANFDGVAAAMQREDAAWAAAERAEAALAAAERATIAAQDDAANATAKAWTQFERAEAAEAALAAAREALRDIKTRADRPIADGHGYHLAVLDIATRARRALLAGGGTPGET